MPAINELVEHTPFMILVKYSHKESLKFTQFLFGIVVTDADEDVVLFMIVLVETIGKFEEVVEAKPMTVVEVVVRRVVEAVEEAAGSR